jgi:glycerophosphoryl diester phosphodiesterase
LHTQYPEIKTSLLVEDYDKRDLEVQLKNLGFLPAIYSPHYSLVTDKLIQRCHEKGIKIIPWTVNELDEMRKLKTMKVDGLISDYPDLFQELSLK